jgi:hypothetical protein
MSLLRQAQPTVAYIGALLQSRSLNGTLTNARLDAAF